MQYKKNRVFDIIYLISILVIVGCDSTSSSCKLDKMCDEYQRMADKMIRATQSNDFTTIQSISSDIQNWMSKWEGELNSNSCNQEEMMNASSRMMSIAQSLMQ